jgi:nucleotide-binding universal stress UspA family protein
MKTILVPIDFSKCSLSALAFAASVAKKTKSTLHLFNVTQEARYYFIADPVAFGLPYGGMDNLYENIRSSSDKKMEALLNKDFLKGLKVIITTIIGDPTHIEITKHAEKIKADIIIMGSNGAGGVTGVLLGSTSERVARFSKKPVLIISSKIKNPDLKRIVFASDFRKEAYSVFPFIKSFAEIFSADLHLLTVNTSAQFSTTKANNELLDSFTKKFKLSAKKIIYDDYMKEEGILNYSEECDADLIAIGTHGKKGLARFFKQDVSGDMVRLSPRPILVINLNK